MSTQYDPRKHHRRSIRLQDYDYAQAGAYFVTICVQDRQCLLGCIANDVVCLNDAGQMIARWRQELAHKFPSVELDAYVIMPNHIHGIIITIADADVGFDTQVGLGGAHAGVGAHAGAPLPQIVQWFKTMTTNEYIRGVKEKSWLPFPGRLWQRNYYEHVVRSDQDLQRIRRYIEENPLKWALDTENPDNPHP